MSRCSLLARLQLQAVSCVDFRASSLMARLTMPASSSLIGRHCFLSLDPLITLSTSLRPSALTALLGSLNYRIRPLPQSSWLGE